MTRMQEDIKTYFESMQQLKEAETSLSEKPGHISKEAHDAIVALAQNERAKKAGDEKSILHPDHEKKLHNTVSSELMGSHDKPGIVTKFVHHYANKMKQDPDEVLSYFIGGGSSEKSKHMPMKATYLKHGEDILSKKDTPDSFMQALHGNIQRGLASILKLNNLRKRKETIIKSGEGEREGPTGPSTAVARQREMSPPEATKYNEAQKHVADLIHKHIEDARKHHGEKGNELSIHPDTMHDILHHHFFHGMNSTDLLRKFGHKIAIKTSSGNADKDSERKYLKIHKDLTDFKKNHIQPHFDKPKPTKQEEPVDTNKLASATKVVSDVAPDPDVNPKGREEFAKAAKFYRSATKKDLPIEKNRNVRLSRESPKTIRAISKLKSNKMKPDEDPNLEPETPSPEAPKTENLAQRLFGNSILEIFKD